MNAQNTNSLQKLVENASQLSQGLETLKLQNGTLLDGLSRQEEEAARRKLHRMWAYGCVHSSEVGPAQPRNCVCQHT